MVVVQLLNGGGHRGQLRDLAAEIMERDRYSLLARLQTVADARPELGGQDTKADPLHGPPAIRPRSEGRRLAFAGAHPIESFPERRRQYLPGLGDRQDPGLFPPSWVQRLARMS